MEIQVDIGENWYDPQKFVDALKRSEDLGFKTAWFGDHFMPWFHSGRRAQFIWSTLGVAFDRTESIRAGPLVSSPIGARYHPAIIAQASATLDNLFPGRLLLGVGTGEALNERPFWNDDWPDWADRMERLTEGLRLVRKLWESKNPFAFEGKYFSSEYYFLYTKPKTRIPVYFAGQGPQSAYYAGKYGDRFVTLSPRNNPKRLREKVLPAYRKGLKESGRKGGLVVHVDFSMGTPEEMKKKDWKSLGWIRKDSWSLKNPMEIEEEGKRVSVSELKRNVHFVKNWRGLLRVIESYGDLGAEAVILITEANLRKIKEVADNVLHLF